MVFAVYGHCCRNREHTRYKKTHKDESEEDEMNLVSCIDREDMIIGI